MGWILGAKSLQLLKKTIMLSTFLLPSMSKLCMVTKHRGWLWHDTLFGNLNLVSGIVLWLAFFSCFMKMDPRRIRTVGESKQSLLSSRVRLSTKIACLLCHTWMVFFMLNITAKKVVKKYFMVKQCNAIRQK